MVGWRWWGGTRDEPSGESQADHEKQREEQRVTVSLQREGSCGGSTEPARGDSNQQPGQMKDRCSEPDTQARGETEGPQDWQDSDQLP